MVEVLAKNVEKNLVYSPDKVELPQEYFVIQNNIALYRKLFKHKFVDGYRDNQLAAFLDYNSAKDLEKSGIEQVLLKWLSHVMGGKFDSKKLGDICPDCLTKSVRSFSRNGDDIARTCDQCGVEVEAYTSIEDLDTSIDYGQTWQVVSPINESDGPGGTFHPRNTREVRDHMNYAYKLVNDGNITFGDFQKQLPEVAAKFEVPLDEMAFCHFWMHLEDPKAKIENVNYSCSNTVVFKDFVFCKVGHFVRRKPKKEYDAFWHGEDPMLRLSVLLKQTTFKGMAAKEKVYALSLCKDYGLGASTNDQALINSLAIMIKNYKPLVELREKHLNFHVYVNTLFVMLMYAFGKEKAKDAEANLKMSYKLIGFIDDARELYRKDADANEEDGRLLLAALAKHKEAMVMLP